MTICSKTLDAVRKRLEERKSLDEIGQELCDAVDDPRGKAIRMVKQAMGKDDAEKYLTENAEWLGYKVNYIRNPEGSKIMSKITGKQIPILESKDAVVLPKDVDILPKDVEVNFGLCLDNNRLHPFLNKENKDNGIAIFGKLEEAEVNWWVQIEPSIEIDAFGFGAEIDLYYIKVTRWTRIYKKGDKYEDENIDSVNTDDEDFKMTIINTIYPVKRCGVGFYIDCFTHSDKLHDKIKKFAQGLSNDFPKLPKFRKSQHPDWEWSYALTKRLMHKEWKENLENYGPFDMALIDWGVHPYPVEE